MKKNCTIEVHISEHVDYRLISRSDNQLISIFHLFNVSFVANINLFAVICSIAFISIAIIILIIVLSMKRHSAKYYTNEDKRGGK